jgi:YD repeat-containing protein
VQTTTNSDGSFSLVLPDDTATTVKINGVAQQLSVLLGHQLYAGADNQIATTIYAPTIDTSATQINGTTVTNSSLPQVSLQLPTAVAGIGIGSVSPALVAADLFATGTPQQIVAVTLGSTSLTAPARLSVANQFTVAAGTVMDLWQIDPNTGAVVKVGSGKVSSDAKLIDTVSGGIATAGWYYYVPTPVEQQSPDDNPFNYSPSLDIPEAAVPINSEANLLSGRVTDSYQLQGYQALGANRSLQLGYSSARANPETVITFDYKAFKGSLHDGLYAKIVFNNGAFASSGATNYWQFTEPPTEDPVRASLKLDRSGLATGIYDYDIAMGLRGPSYLDFLQSQNRTVGSFIYVNTADSPFGAGWGLAGLQQIFRKGTLTTTQLLLVDGNGTEQVFIASGRDSDNNLSYTSLSGDLSKLVEKADRSFQRVMTDGTTYEFRAVDGKLTSVKDRNGNITAYNYDGAGVIQSIVDPVGLVTLFVKNGNRIIEIIDSADRVTKLEYNDGNGNLTKITDPGGSVSEWGYDPVKHLMTRSKDKRGNEGRDFYDEFGRVYLAERKDGSTVSFVQDNSNSSSVPGYVINVNTNNIQGNPQTSATYQLVPTSSTNPKITIVDGNSETTTQTFNKNGQPLVIESPDGIQTNKYDRRGFLVQSVDKFGGTTSYRYNDRNQVVEIAYGDKLSADASLRLYGSEPDRYSNPTDIAQIGYLSDFYSQPIVGGGTQTTNYKFVVAASKQGQISLRSIEPDGTIDPVNPNLSFSLKKALKSKYNFETDENRITVKKLLIEDFNGDGKQDIVVGYDREYEEYFSPVGLVNFAGGGTFFVGGGFLAIKNYASVATFLGNGAGGFTLNDNTLINPIQLFDDYQFDIADLVSADFNGDGKRDLIVANAINYGAVNWVGRNNYELYTLTNNGSGNTNLR